MSLFPKRWPPQFPERLQLYSLATPNGQKVGIMLEETELPYEAHLIDITANDQFDEDFVKLNPNSKIPVILDPDGPGGQPISFMESGAILMYLADKTNKFLSKEPRMRWETLQWLFFQNGHVGPMFGQFGHFYKYAADKTQDSYGVERYTKETRRLLALLDKRMADREWIMGEEMTIADIAIVPWVKGLDFYDGHQLLETETFRNVIDWRDRFYNRPAVARGAEVCAL